MKEKKDLKVKLNKENLDSYLKFLKENKKCNFSEIQELETILDEFTTNKTMDFTLDNMFNLKGFDHLDLFLSNLSNGAKTGQNKLYTTKIVTFSDGSKEMTHYPEGRMKKYKDKDSYMELPSKISDNEISLTDIIDSQIQKEEFEKDKLYLQKLLASGIFVKPQEEIDKDRLLYRQRYFQGVRRKLKYYALENDFTYFVTLTFAPSDKWDREDYLSTTKCLTRWRKSIVAKYGPMPSIFVPEYHKDGKGIHFHGLINPPFELDKTIDKNGKLRFHLPLWKYGFDDCDLIRDKERTATYITKYLSKDLERNPAEKYKRRRHYFPSKGLKLPKIELVEMNDEDFKNLPDKPNWSNDNETVEIYRFNKNGDQKIEIQELK